MDITLKVLKIQILTGRGPDRIGLTLDAPTPYPECGYDAEVTVQTRAGFACEWLKDALGIETGYEVIDMVTGRTTQV